MSPNQSGNFPRVFVRQEESAEIGVLVPDASVGDQVVVNVLDGGALDGAAHDDLDGKYSVRPVDEDRMVRVRFAPTANPGTHRLRFSHADQSCVVDLWVGDDNSYQVLSAAE